MLVLTRKVNQSLILETSDGPILIKIIRSGSQVRIGIEAPTQVTVTRDELLKGEDEKCPY